LARPAGLRQTLSFDRSREEEADSGEAIARRLGLEPIVLRRSAWRDLEFPEVPFLAADGKGEDVYFASAAPLLRHRLLLTGYAGSRVWSMSRRPSDDLSRADQSGLSHAEYRLWIGYVHCPVPFLGGRDAESIHAVARQATMIPWDVGGPYNNPICRRILNDAGVTSDLFARTKRAASVLFFDRQTFLTGASMQDFRNWLRNRPSRGRPSERRARHALIPLVDRALKPVRTVAFALQALAQQLTRLVPVPLLARVANSGRLHEFANHEPLFRHLFPWALERAKAKYGAIAAQHRETNP
jgi:hypothetical protein